MKKTNAYSRARTRRRPADWLSRSVGNPDEIRASARRGFVGMVQSDLLVHADLQEVPTKCLRRRLLAAQPPPLHYGSDSQPTPPHPGHDVTMIASRSEALC